MKSVELGSPRGQYLLAKMIKTGRSGFIDFREYMRLMKLSSESGCINGTYHLGYCYYKGLGCDQNYSYAYECFRQCVDQQFLSCYHMLGLMYEHGYYVTQDLKYAEDLYREGANLGSQQSQYHLDLLLKPQLKSSSSYNRAIDSLIAYPYESKIHELCEYKLDSEAEGLLVLYDWGGQEVYEKHQVNIDSLNNNEQQAFLSIGDCQSDFRYDDNGCEIVFNDLKFKRASSNDDQIVSVIQKGRAQVRTLGETPYLVIDIESTILENHEPNPPGYLILPIQQVAVGNASEIYSELFKIYPNPFSNNLNIEFTLAQAEAINLSIFDLDGKLIYSILQHKHFEKGTHSSSTEIDLPHGVYCIRLQTERTIRTRIINRK